MPLRAARTPPTARTSEQVPLRSLSSSGARRTVMVLVGSVVVGTGLGAAGVGIPTAGVERAEASGDAAGLLGSGPAGAASGTGAAAALDARTAAEVSSRSAARDAAVDAEQVRRAEQGSDAAREGAQATRAASAAEVAAQQAAAQAAEAERQRVAAEQAAAVADPRAAGRAMAAQRGWGPDQFACLDNLWTKESGWVATADNPTSDAYGIPQSLPGEKMAAAGADWATNPVTQISWGLTYIADVYGTPCSAWAHSRATNWY